MVIVDKGTFLIIPVIHKPTGKIIQIKNTRFNPQFHELLEGDKVPTKHVIEVTTRDIERLDERMKTIEVQFEATPTPEPTVEIVVDAPVEVKVEEVKAKKRGMPKGGWPKKAALKKKKGE